jgi:hypothetical protein
MLLHSLMLPIGTALALATLPALAQTLNVLGKSSDWVAYTHKGPPQLCFALSQPKDQEPKSARRDPAYLYVTAWPSDAVTGEISIKLGYPLKKGSEAIVTVDAMAFKLFGAADRAYVEDPAQEKRLLETMRKGSKLIVKAQSERGTMTTDTYSLTGLTQALQLLAQGCPTE